MLAGEVIYNGALKPAIEIDEAGNVTDWNEGAEALFGWSASEAVGRQLTDLFVPASEAFGWRHAWSSCALGVTGPRTCCL